MLKEDFFKDTLNKVQIEINLETKGLINEEAFTK